jgi:hypothetical protein
VSIIFCRTTVSLLRSLAEQAVEFSKSSGHPALDMFQAYVGGAFHDIDRSLCDPRIKRTVTFAMESCVADIHPLDIVERLETSLETHGVAWFMLDFTRATQINNTAQKISRYPRGLMLQFEQAGIQCGDALVDFSRCPYLDYKPRSVEQGVALVRKNKILRVVTLIRASDLF